VLSKKRDPFTHVLLLDEVIKVRGIYFSFHNVSVCLLLLYECIRLGFGMWYLLSCELLTRVLVGL
jgi:hypothetical protein